ncbi:MAG: hypothetical protein GW855_01585 [Erythrobacter sp.]|nr:hypothetical protein [Erythrobacter sp.]NCQ64635.1 hypothetical protein [Alphaproteobacteria bacterium]
MIRTIAAVACLLAAGSSATAQTPARPCISPDENEALVAYVMPELIGALELRCARSLPPGAFLGSRSAALQSRLKPQSEKAWPRARKVAQRFAGPSIPIDGPFENIAKVALAPAAATMIARGFDAEQCRVADRLLAELAPLPPANLARVMALFLELGSAVNEDVPFRVCPAD